MSISFSGLASGLDTSSWVESLVALKQAKVNTLQQDKESVMLSRDTLSSIKSFFASFRSTIEKITDSRFNIVSMDLFAQNLAVSANLDVLTATATSEAVEGTYKVKVDKLASNTNATSNYKTIIQTTSIATENSYLKDIGVGTGTIGVTVDGVKYGVAITDKDTIATFINKLEDIGVEANYNSVTGRFNMNISTSDIDDTISNTNIVDRLHLVGVNEGYKTVDKLQIQTVTTEWDKATNSTLLSDLGVNTGTLTINAYGQDYDITLESDDTIGDLVTALKANNIDADFLTEEGIFVLADATITDEGSTNIISAMGLTQEIYSKSQATKVLLHETIITQTTTATSATLLKDIGDGTTITDDQTVIVQNSNNEYTTITVGSESSIGDLLTEISNAGLYATINSNGTVEISGGTITGGTFDAVSALGLQSEPYTAMATGNPLQETVVDFELVTSQSRLVEDLGVTKGYLEITDSNGNKHYEKIYEGQTLSDFMSDLAEIGIYANLDESTGTLEIIGGAFRTLDNANNEVGSLVADGTITESNLDYRQGTNLLACLYGSDTISTDQITVSSTYSRTRALSQTITNTIDATSGTTLGALGLSGDGTATFNVRGETVVIDVTSDMTILGLKNALADNGIEATWDSENSKFTINNATLEGGTSNLSDVLNLTTTIAGKYVTSDALSANTTINIDATRESSLEDIGVNSNETVVLMREDGSSYTFNVAGTTKIGDLIDTLNANGVTAKIENGVFSIDGGYIDNEALENALGLEHVVMGYSNILGNQLTHTVITTATGSTTLGNIISALGMESAVSGGYDIKFNSTDLSVSADTTIDSLMSQIHALGGTTILDSSGKLHINGGTLTGSVATALGFSSTTVTMSVSSTGEVLSTITTAYADTTTALGDLGFEDSTVTILGLNGTTIGTFDTTGEMTIGELFEELSTFGITGNINNGIITLDATNNCYATGGVISAMGIGVADRNYTTTIGGANTSTESVSTTYVVTANSSTTLGELGYTVPSEITISSSDGAELGKITTSADMTIGDMLLSFAGYGISGNISNGYIRLNSPNGNYVTGDLMTSMGITTSESTYTSTEGITSTSSAITYNKTTGAENTSTESVTYTNVIEETVMTTTAIVVTTTATTTVTEAVIGSETITVQNTITTQVTTTDPWNIVLDSSTIYNILQDIDVNNGDVLNLVRYDSNNNIIGTEYFTITNSDTDIKGLMGDLMGGFNFNYSIQNGDTYIFDTRQADGSYYIFSGETAEKLGLINYTVQTITPEGTTTEPIEIVTTIVTESTEPVMITVPVMRTFDYVSGYEMYGIDEYTAFNKTLGDIGYDGGLVIGYTKAGKNVDAETFIIRDIFYNKYGMDIVNDVKIAEALDFIQNELAESIDPNITLFSWDFDNGYLNIHTSDNRQNNSNNEYYFHFDKNDAFIKKLINTMGLGEEIIDQVTRQTGTTVVQDMTTILTTSTVTTTEITTEVQTQTVSSTFTVTDETLATGSTKLYDIIKKQGLDPIVLRDLGLVTIEDRTGQTRITTLSIRETTTIDELVSMVNQTARCEVLSFDTTTGKLTMDNDIVAGMHFILEGTLAEALGFNNITYSTITIPSTTATVGATAVSSSAVTYLGTVTVGDTITTDGTQKAVTYAQDGTTGDAVRGGIFTNSQLNRTMNAIAGINSTDIVRCMSYGTSCTVTILSTDTLQSVINKFAEYDIYVYEKDLTGMVDATTGQAMVGCRYDISANENAYITSISGTLTEALLWNDANYGLKKASGRQYYINPNRESGVITIKETTSLYNLGANSNSDIEIAVNKDGVSYTLSYDKTNTIRNVKNELADLGINLTLDVQPPASGTGGSVTMTFTSEDGSYIEYMSNDFKSIFKVSDEPPYTHDEERSFNATSSTQLSAIGLSAGNHAVTVVSEGTTYSFTLNENNTTGDLFTALAGLGVSASISNGTVTIIGTEDSYISGMSTDLASALKLNQTQFSTTSVSATSTTMLFDNQTQQSDPLYYNNYRTVTVQDTVTSTVITGTTLVEQTVISTFTEPKTTIVQNTTLVTTTIPGTETGVDPFTITIFNSQTYDSIQVTTSQITVESTTTTTREVTTYATALVETTTFITQTTTDTSAQLTSDTRFEQLGITGDKEIELVSNGNQYTITVEAEDTLNDLIVTLAGYGISASVNSGKLTLQGNENSYITSIDDDLETALKLNADSSNFTIDSSVQMTSSTRLAQLGATSAGTITVVSNGTVHTLTVDTSNTVGDMLVSLAGLGIYGTVNNGVLTLQGYENAYIQGMSNLDCLNLNNNFYTTSTHSTLANTPSTRQGYETTNVLTTDDTFEIFGLSANDTISVVSDGVEHVVTVRSTDTVGDLLTTLAGLGISGNINDGVLTLQGGNNAFVNNIGTGLQHILNLSGDVNYTTVTQTSTSNTNSDQLSSNAKDVATGLTELQNLRQEDGSSLANYSIILSTTSNTGNASTTLSFSATDTVHDVIDALAENGINTSIDSAGRFSVSSSTLTDFDISGDLGTFIMGAYSKHYDEGTVNNTSANLIQKSVVNMSDSTSLADLNITNGNVLLYQNGEVHTIAIDNTTNIGDFRNTLAGFGINSNIINGRLQLQADGVVYLDSTAGGSNLASIMGLEQASWDLGNFSQNSRYLSRTQTAIRSATMNCRISELTDGTGNSLGVTAGQIYVYQDGTRNLINIDTNDTLQDLANKLSQYGISTGISSDGKIYFNGNNNSYLTTTGITPGAESNILDKFNISDNWETRSNSTSGKLSYEVESSSFVDGNTKLVNLTDEFGNSLGITTGNYNIYHNGVKITQSITADTTVDEFLATLDYYGISANFAGDGSLVARANDETYLATSNTAGNDTNAIDVLFEPWSFVNAYKTNTLGNSTTSTIAVTEETRLADIAGGNFQEGYITVVKDGIQTNIELTGNHTLGSLMNELELYGFDSTINGNGQLIIKNTGNSSLKAYTGPNAASNALDILGLGDSSWVTTNSYHGDTINVTTTTPLTLSSDRDTKLSDMGITTGEYYIYKDGVKYTAFVSTDETLGSFINTLQSFGIETSLVDTGAGSILSIEGNGNSYIAKSNDTANASNIVDTLFTNPLTENYKYSGVQEISSEVTTLSNATEDSLLSEFDNGLLIAQGNLVVNVDGIDTIVQIQVDETVGSLLNKFRALGLEASLSDGHVIIQSGYKTVSINADETTSSLLTTLNMTFRNDLGGYVSSSDEIEQTISEEKLISVSNFANYDTKMGLLNISSGSISIYRDGEKAIINIDSEQTFGDLRRSILDNFADVDLKIDENTGYLEIYSTTDGVSVEVGSTTDTSNFTAITGIANRGNGISRSARELYCVNSSSKITTSGIFRNGDVVEGTFYIGDAEFTIDENTTLNSLISQINTSDRANATAYWDSLDGKFVIKSRTTGAALVNIEAGSSNFTDIMGFTKSEWADADGDGNQDIGQSNATSTKINVEAQKVGDNAKFSINGTYYTSTSNTITSDVSRIQGLTINLKGVSDEEVILTVEKDKETVTNAVSDIVDAYNELIENVNKEVAKGSPLDDQSTLKFIRNQIRSLMTSSMAGNSVFKNLDAIGITLESASTGNIRTDNIHTLTFDREKFMQAFSADKEALKNLLVGTDSNLGIFQRVEKVVESAIDGTMGYFSSAERSYNKQLSRIDDKIQKAKTVVERYRERLEAKFASMDLLISNIQNQYSSFLGT